MNRRLLNVLRVVVSVGLLAFVLWRNDPATISAELRQGDARFLIAALMLFLLGLVIHAYRWLVLVRGLDRMRALEFIDAESYLRARIEVLASGEEETPEVRTLHKTLQHQLKGFFALLPVVPDEVRSNLLAVEVHQRSGFSSDMSFDSLLEAGEAASVLEFAWAGALTPTSIRVNARTSSDSSTVRLHVSENGDLSGSRVSGYYTADEATNALVITAEPIDYETLLPVIRKLDIRRPQAFIEALIMEVDLDKTLDVGTSQHIGTQVGGADPTTIFGAFGSGGVGSLGITASEETIAGLAKAARDRRVRPRGRGEL